MRLAAGGPTHAKYRRMITVYMDITAPLYWWNEFDTYKVETVANSCSTMHKIAAKEFTIEDFSCEHLNRIGTSILWDVIDILNIARKLYLDGGCLLYTSCLLRTDSTKTEQSSSGSMWYIADLANFQRLTNI